MRLITGAHGRVRPLSAWTRRTDDTQAAALAGLGAGSLFDRGFMVLNACIKKAACKKHFRRWPSASTPLSAAGSSRQGRCRARRKSRLFAPVRVVLLPGGGWAAIVDGVCAVVDEGAQE